MLAGDGKALDHPREVAGEMAHDLHAFFVLHDLLGTVAMHHGPILAGSDGHAGDGEVLIELIDGGGGAGTASTDNGGSGLAAHDGGTGIEHPVHQGSDGATGRGVMHRRAEDEAVALRSKIERTVDKVIAKDAAGGAGLEAGVAAGTAADGLGAELEQFGFNALFVKNLFDFAKGGLGAAVRMRAAINQKNFHDD